MELKDYNTQEKYVEDVISKLSAKDKNEWKLYDILSSTFSNLCLVALITGVAISGSGVLKGHMIEKRKPAIVNMYDEVSNIYRDAVKNYDPNTSDKAVLEEIATLEYETERLKTDETYKHYEAKLLSADKTTFYGLISGILVASLYGGIGSFYFIKRDKLEFGKEIDV